MEEATVTITLKEYVQLLEDSHFLNALQVVGVDNWVGYEDAIEIMEESY